MWASLASYPSLVPCSLSNFSGQDPSPTSCFAWGCKATMMTAKHLRSAECAHELIQASPRPYGSGGSWASPEITHLAPPYPARKSWTKWSNSTWPKLIPAFRTTNTHLLCMFKLCLLSQGMLSPKSEYGHHPNSLLSPLPTSVISWIQFCEV